MGNGGGLFQESLYKEPLSDCHAPGLIATSYQKTPY